jgi:two-component system CheB/CheR fusion protein
VFASRPVGGEQDEKDTTTDEAFTALLPYMRDSRGFDFTGYKHASLIRRVRHRITQSG